MATSVMKNWQNWFRAEGFAFIEISPKVKVFMQELTQGTKNVWADLKASGEVSNMEGKLPITLEGYKSLCQSALLKSGTGNESILVHSFRVLCWNLSARASADSSVLWNNIGWDGDCLTVLYEKGKTNQDD